MQINQDPSQHQECHKELRLICWQSPASTSSGIPVTPNLIQSSVNGFSISIVKNSQQNCKKTSKAKGTQLTKSDMQWKKCVHKCLGFRNFWRT